MSENSEILYLMFVNNIFYLKADNNEKENISKFIKVNSLLENNN